ncbi:MAG: phenylalanine--tRNA ligase subunit alpha [Candidatus Aenigmarchaeota archaeon]|nr:phenylalanine--tRNA ligase subunit alpha [Candidatus Aenigmarchaeota archaeon]
MKQANYRLTEEGRSYLASGLPEMRLMKLLEKGRKKVEELSVSMEGKELSIAMQHARARDLISIRDGFVEMVSKHADFPEHAWLKKLAEGKGIEEKGYGILLKRRLIEEIKADDYEKARRFAGREIAAVDSSLLKTGLWRQTILRPYNIRIAGKAQYPGRPHIISHFMERVRNIFLDLGFSEASGPLIESGFWNFDALFQPQDHPARDMADTFYMAMPERCSLPGKKIVGKVKEAHEKGVGGSRGWRYVWDEEVSMQAVLRTHTTAVSARMLSKVKPPAKVFCIGRVFRNETIDYKHLVELTQIEGIVVDENAAFGHLLGYLKEFYRRMGFERIRFRPAYFPYTEMSVEPEVWIPERQEWMELGGAGIFRPEVTIPLGVACPVLAFGLGLERLVMVRTGIKDIREFYYRNDLEILRNAVLWP